MVRMNSTMRYWLQRILLLCFTVVLFASALAAAEWGLRLRNPRYLAEISIDSSNYMSTYSETLGWVLLKNFKGGVLFDKPTTVNSRGYRGKEYPYERTPGKTRVLLLGDSITFGLLVGDDETFASRLDRGNLEVINF